MGNYRTVKYPPTAFWEVTAYCNHNCVHCFNYWRTDEEVKACMSKGMDTAQYLAIAEKIIKNQPARVVFTGGEPLVAFDRIKPALELLQENKISISINTNAALITREMAEYFVRRRVGLFVSFPSEIPEEFDRIVSTPGAYKRVVEAMDICKEVGVIFSFNMVVSRINLHSIFETARFLKERYGANRISVTRVSEPINAIDRFDEYMLDEDDFAVYLENCCRVSDELDMKVKAASPITPCSIGTQDAYDIFAFAGSCEAGKSSYVVTAEGKVRACARDSKEYGDIQAEPFADIWERMSEWRDESMIPVECAGCEVRDACRGGCRVDGLPRKCKYNCLDTYSDLKRLPLVFKKTPEYLPRWNYDTYFSVQEYLRFVEEDFGMRISYRGNHVYCTKAFAEYIDSFRGKGFTLDEFSKKFDLELDVTRQALKGLRDKGIIQSSDY